MSEKATDTDARRQVTHDWAVWKPCEGWSPPFSHPERAGKSKTPDGWDDGWVIEHVFWTMRSGAIMHYLAASRPRAQAKPMTIILRHTSAAGPVRLDIEHTPARGDRLEHTELGICVVSHVYDGSVPVVVAVKPREDMVAAW